MPPAIIGQADQVDLRPSAGRTGHHLDAALAKAQCLQDQLRRADLFRRIPGQGDADRIADALMENDPQANG